MKEAAFSRLSSDSKGSLAVLTPSGEKRLFKQIRLSVIRAANAFLASLKSRIYGFKLHVALSVQSFPHSLKSFFIDNGIIGILEEADMNRFDTMSSLLIGLSFNRYCGEDKAASGFKAFATYQDLLLCAATNTVGSILEISKNIQKSIWIYKNATRKASQDGHSLFTLKWDLMQYIVEDVS